MNKAILELPKMPQNCWECEFITTLGICTVLSKRNQKNGVRGSDMYAYAPYKDRRSDCPLKLVEIEKLAAKEVE
jgi:hypothetical protein